MKVVAQSVHIIGRSISGFRVGKDEPTTTFRLSASSWDVGDASGGERLVYGLTNLPEFPGNSSRSFENEAGYEGWERCTRLTLGEVVAAIEHRDDAKFLLKELSITRGIAVTAEAVVHRSTSDISACDAAITRMCHLLTLALGTTVSWIYRTAVASNGRVMGTHRVAAVTKPYHGGIPLIADEDICAFVQSAYLEWDRAELNWRIRDSILAYTDAKIQVDYLESRSLKMAVLLEHLKGLFLERSGREFKLPDTAFKAVLPMLKERTLATLQDLLPDQPDDVLSQLASGLEGLHRTSFRAALRGAAAELRVPISSGELNQVVAVRNRLIHAMRFSDESGLKPHEQYFLLATVAGKLMLASLGYEGRFYDWTKSNGGEPATLIPLTRT